MVSQYQAYISLIQPTLPMESFTFEVAYSFLHKRIEIQGLISSFLVPFVNDFFLPCKKLSCFLLMYLEI